MLITMERILNQEDFQKKYIQYRNYPEIYNKEYEKFFDTSKKGGKQSRKQYGVGRARKQGGHTEQQAEKKKENINKKRFEKLFTFQCDKT